MSSATACETVARPTPSAAVKVGKKANAQAVERRRQALTSECLAREPTRAARRRSRMRPAPSTDADRQPPATPLEGRPRHEVECRLS